MGISREQALDCFRSDDLIGIGMEADAVRRRLHPEGVVSYAIERRVNADGVDEGPLDRRVADICEEIRETVELGGVGVRITFGVGAGASAWQIKRVEAVLQGVRLRFPKIWLEGLSAAEVRAVARSCGLELRETIARLRDSGLDAIAGDAMDIDGSGVREWAEVQRAAHGTGMRTVATMLFAAGGVEERVDLLEAVRRMQEETGGFAAFVPVCVAARGDDREAPTAVEYLKTLAIARMFLDNVEHVQFSGAMQGLKVLQMGLRFGANDAGPVRLAGAPAGDRTRGVSASEEDLRRVIRDAGFGPVQRDMAYRTMFLN